MKKASIPNFEKKEKKKITYDPLRPFEKRNMKVFFSSPNGGKKNRARSNPPPKKSKHFFPFV